MAAMFARVDPRPVRPPNLGLLASANNVVVGSDYDNGANVNLNAMSDTATGPAPWVEGDGAPDDYEHPAIGPPVHWIRGFSFRPEVCDGGDVIAPDGAVVGTPPALPDAITMVPYIVEGVDQLSTFGATTDAVRAERRDYARRQLLACESQQIERELWKGTLSTANGWGNRYLADNTVSLVEGDRLLGYVTALAVLERAINDGTCGAQGMIHARTDTVSIWHTGGALRRVGNLILTIHDTIVVPGGGYDGSGPASGTVGLDPSHAGVVPSSDSAWAYATTIVDVRRGAFMSEQPLDERVTKSTNVLTTYERRPAAATWGCVHVGVHVDHTTDKTITGS